MASLDELMGKKPNQDSTLSGLLSNQGVASVDTPASDVAQVEANNARNRAVLDLLGEKDPTKKSKTSALDKILGTLDAPGTGVRSLVHNLANSSSDKDVDVLDEMLKAVKGESRVAGAHILSDFGVNNKWAKLLGGFALDVALDPLTYLTGGYSNLTKAESVAELARIADTGLDAAKAADLGLDFTQFASKADDAGRVLAADLSKEEARAIAAAVRKSVGTARGDAGGLKFMGQTIVGDQGAREATTYALKDFARKRVPGADWFERAFNSGDYTDLGKMGNEVFDAGFKMAEKQTRNRLAQARTAGEEFRKEIETLVPDQTTRDLITYGIGKQFGDLTSNGALRDANQVLGKNLKKFKSAADPDVKKAAWEAVQVARDGVRREVAGLTFDPMAIRTTLENAGITGTQLDDAVEAAGRVQTRFDELVAERGAAGLDNWTLFGGAKDANPDMPLSAGYAPGMTGEARQSTLDAIGLPVASDALTDPSKRSTFTITEAFGGKPSAYKSKSYLTAEQRMLEGGLLTELDAATLAGAKVKKDYADIALKQWEDTLGRLTGQGSELTPEIQQFVAKTRDAFTNDDATRGFLKGYDTVLNWWKKGATIYNFPRFPARNSISNQWLLWSENLWDAGAQKQAIDLIGKSAAGKELTEAEGKLLKAAQDAGVMQRAADLMQLVGEGKTKIPGLKQYEGFASGANELIENQSRLAGFIAARNKGLSDEAAGLMVDKALYDYSGGALTEFESAFMKRLVPFYTWMKQNTKHLVELTAKSPGKITATTHLVENARAATPVDQSVMPEWMTESMAIPLPFKQKGETQMVTLKGLLPVGDLENLTPAEMKSLEGIPEPFKTILGMGANGLTNMSPIVKTPLELIMNRDLYYGDQVQEFAGQTRRAPTYVEQFDDLVTMVPGIRDVWAGVKEAFSIGEKVDEASGEPYLVMDARAAKAMKDLLPWFNYVGRTIDRTPESELSRWGRTLGVPVRSFETDKFARQKAYDDQAQLQDLLRGLQSQGKGDAVEAARAAVPNARSAKKKSVTLDQLLGR